MPNAARTSCWLLPLLLQLLYRGTGAGATLNPAPLGNLPDLSQTFPGSSLYPQSPLAPPSLFAPNSPSSRFLSDINSEFQSSLQPIQRALTEPLNPTNWYQPTSGQLINVRSIPHSDGQQFAIDQPGSPASSFESQPARRATDLSQPALHQPAGRSIQPALHQPAGRYAQPDLHQPAFRQMISDQAGSDQADARDLDFEQRASSHFQLPTYHHQPTILHSLSRVPPIPQFPSHPPLNQHQPLLPPLPDHHAPQHGPFFPYPNAPQPTFGSFGSVEQHFPYPPSGQPDFHQHWYHPIRRENALRQPAFRQPAIRLPESDQFQGRSDARGGDYYVHPTPAPWLPGPLPVYEVSLPLHPHQIPHGLPSFEIYSYPAPPAPSPPAHSPPSAYRKEEGSDPASPKERTLISHGGLLTPFGLLNRGLIFRSNDEAMPENQASDQSGFQPVQMQMARNQMEAEEAEEEDEMPEGARVAPTAFHKGLGGLVGTKGFGVAGHGVAAGPLGVAGHGGKVFAVRPPLLGLHGKLRSADGDQAEERSYAPAPAPALVPIGEPLSVPLTYIPPPPHPPATLLQCQQVPVHSVPAY